ncbi:MAG: tetratricopeptide repeat protein [Armatimonadota bacterium]
MTFYKHSLRMALLVVVAMLIVGGRTQPVSAQTAQELSVQAQQFIQKKQYSEAIKTLKKLTAITPKDQQAWFNLGVLQYQTGNSPEARGAFTKAYKLNQKSALGQNSLQAMNGILQTLAQTGKSAEAKVYAETLEQLNPNDPNPQFALGLLAMQQKKFQDAAYRFRRVIEISPKNPMAWMNLGLAEVNRKHFKEASEAFTKASALNPGDPRPKAMLAEVARRSGDLPTAAKAYQSLVSANPNDPMARTQYGMILEQQKKNKEAIVQYKKAVSLNPRDFAAQMNLGRLAFMSGDHKTAEQAYSAAVKVDPKSSLALSNLALTKTYVNKTSEAEAIFQKAIAADKSNSNAYEGLAFVYETQQKFPQAIKQLEKGRQVTADKDRKAQLTERIARLYERTGKQEEALKIWNQRAAETKKAAPYREIARLEMTRGKYQEAAGAFEKAADIDKQSAQDLQQAAQMWNRAKQSDKAISVLERMKKLDTKKLDPYFMEAMVYSDAAVEAAPDKSPEKADYTKALAEYESAEKIDPKNVQVYIGKATLYERQKKPDLAIAEYRKLEEKAPDQAELSQILTKIPQILEQEKKPDEAIAEYQRIAAKFPKDGKVEMMLGDALAKKGDNAGAIAAFEEAFKRDNTLTAVLSREADVQAKAGQPDEARKTYVRLAQIAPASTDALSKLKEGYGKENKPEEFRKFLLGLVAQKPKIGGPPYQQFLDEYAAAGLTNEALGKFQELSAKTPSADLSLYTAKAQRMLGQNKEGVATLSAALKKDPDNLALHREIAMAYLELKNNDRAVAHLKKVVDQPFSFDFESKNTLARIYENQGRKKEALEYYKQVLQMMPSNQQAREAVDRMEGKPKASVPASPALPAPGVITVAPTPTAPAESPGGTPSTN